uniref:Peptidase S1 domain-containing protein n=1 Tax=Biomphalaria glabrata TaxID=6526 RepID=A0A2C9LKC4_BIOGL
MQSEDVKVVPQGSSDHVSQAHESCEGHKTQDQSKEFTGEYEIQVNEGLEVDLHKHNRDCRKNPGHQDFIPVYKFKLTHLPEPLRDDLLFDFIKVTADLTVRISVKMTSPNRPQFWPRGDRPFPLYDLRGSETLRSGTGRIWNVKKVVNGVDQFGIPSLVHCWCKKCERNARGGSLWWEVEVDTATHVIYDDIEARSTSVRLFFDQPNSPAVLLDQGSFVGVNIDKDSTLLKYVTCDIELGSRLFALWDRWDGLWSKVCEKYKKTRDDHKLTFIVSHPHGFSKQVSIGQWVEKRQEGNVAYNFQFSYTTCTCPGSSGAPVNILGYSTGWGEHSHSGACDTEDGLNFCGFGYVA